MESRFQYCTAADGTRIAYHVQGNEGGVPLVYAPAPPFSNLRESWFPFGGPVPDTRRKVCVLDFRGCGLSDRNVADLSLEALCSDLEAVTDRLGWERFSLLSMGMSGPVAILYTVRHPERVARLILRDTYLRASEMGRIPRMRALGAVLRADWESYCDLMALTIQGWDDPDAARDLSRLLAQNYSHEEVLAYAAATASYDVSAIVNELLVPTLIMNPNFMPVPSADMARAMGSRIADSRLLLYSQDERDRLFALVEEFLADGDPAPDIKANDSVGASHASQFRTVLFTDLVGHSEMMARLGDERGRAVLREHEDITRNLLKQHGGTEVKTMGDGFMASFGSVTKAVECAVALQQAFADRQGEPLSVRVGLNAGEPIEEEGDLFGATVILASRIAAKADAGEILVADTVRGLCSGKGFLFADRGEFVAKGFEDPVHVYEVSWRHTTAS